MSKPAKTYEYIVVLKSNSLKWVDWISRLMLLLALTAFLYDCLVQSNHNGEFSFSGSTARLLIASIVIIGWWLYCYRLESQGQPTFYRFALMIAAWGWYMYPKGYYLCIGYLIAAVLEKPVKIQPEVAVDEEEIVFNTLPVKTYSWDSVNNVIMKDGILTIDFKNNKLYQKEINDAVSREIEKEFNIFCEQQLKG